METLEKEQTIAVERNRREVVGSIFFYQTDGEVSEKMEYFSKESYLGAIKKELDINPDGFNHQTKTSDPEVIKSVDDLIYGAYGEENPYALDWYSSHIDFATKKRISDIHIFSLKNGGMAICCKIDGFQQDAIKMSKEDVNSLTEKTDRYSLITAYFSKSLDRRENQQFKIPNSIKGVRLSEEQRTKLKAGEAVYLKNMISNTGKKFSSAIYLDKEEKKIKFKPLEGMSQKKGMPLERRHTPVIKPKMKL